jgi:hypothetical protein
MRVAFPDAAGNPDYGLASGSPALTAFTEDQILTFIRANIRPYGEDRWVTPYLEHHIDPAAIGGSRCAGATASPTWNFILVNASLMPRNARPADYDIGLNIRSHGRVVAQVKLNRTLVLDEPVVYGLFVPLRTDQMDSFDGVEMVFAKKA